MNKGSMRILAIVVLVGLLALSWYNLINTTVQDDVEFNSILKTAREKRELGLYADAIDYYLAALEERDSLSLRDEIAQTYLDAGQKLAYEDFCEEILTDYPLEDVGYVRMAEFYKNGNDYYEAFTMINNAAKRGVISSKLDAMVEEMAYLYEIDRTSYINVGLFSAKYCAVQREDGKWGYINRYGTVKMQFIYSDASAFSAAGMAAVQTKDGRYGLIDTTGRLKSVDAEAKKIEDCTELISGLMAVKYDGKYHYCNSNFVPQFEGAYDYAGAFQGDVAAVMNDGKWSIINSKGERLSSATFDEIKVDDKGIAFRNGVAFAKKGDKYILIDTAGNQVGKESWEDADAFNGTEPAAVKKNGKWGFVDTAGKVVVEYQYENAKSFYNAMAAVSLGEKWGYICVDDFSMKIECKFEEANDFSDAGSAFVKWDNKWCLLKIYRLSKNK